MELLIKLIIFIGGVWSLVYGIGHHSLGFIILGFVLLAIVGVWLVIIDSGGGDWDLF